MYQSFIKRFFDLLFSMLLLPIFLILYLFVGIAIKLEDKGPIFYNADRMGKNKELFKMYKFRSMKNEAPDIRNEDGTTFNSENDPRVTRVGRFIRKTSIDEVPQVVNVFLGDMSFIGPRPSPLGDKSMYPSEFNDKFKVKPGITGYNQAIQRNEATMPERIKNDSYYVDNLSFLLDIKILVATATSVLGKKNIYRND